MSSSIEKKLLFIQGYCVVLTLGIAATTAAMFLSKKASTQSSKFQDITVERINVVDSAGTLNMVIANKAKQHPGITDGVMSEPRDRAQGVIFFNDKGDEVGGLTFGGDGVESQNVHLSFDKARNDQTITLDHSERADGKYFAGMRITDRPNVSLNQSMAKFKEIEKIKDEAKRNQELEKLEASGEMGVPRIMVGRGYSKDAVISLSDGKGRERLSIMVSDSGEASIEFLDEQGKTTSRFPPVATTAPAAP
jgi:hypothetical protein